jgi:hypothetical protein
MMEVWLMTAKICHWIARRPSALRPLADQVR